MSKVSIGKRPTLTCTPALSLSNACSVQRSKALLENVSGKVGVRLVFTGLEAHKAEVLLLKFLLRETHRDAFLIRQLLGEARLKYKLLLEADKRNLS